MKKGIHCRIFSLILTVVSVLAFWRLKTGRQISNNSNRFLFAGNLFSLATDGIFYDFSLNSHFRHTNIINASVITAGTSLLLSEPAGSLAFGIANPLQF